jgi:hypothetical protein
MTGLPGEPGVRGRIVLSLVLALCAAAPAAARAEPQQRGTLAQRIACTPDVFRLCGHVIPNIPRIIACLKSQRRNLNPDCRAVFEGRLR